MHQSMWKSFGDASEMRQKSAESNTQGRTLTVPSQLAITLFHFGHFGSAASVDAIAQWAGCSAGAVVNSTCCIIKAFLLLHDQAI